MMMVVVYRRVLRVCCSDFVFDMAEELIEAVSEVGEVGDGEESVDGEVAYQRTVESHFGYST